ncbi:MAG: hypothetical protein RML95_12345 [Anaerolineae bacterium]|nr:hypothetical protein [Anaerolineae bacterium]
MRIRNFQFRIADLATIVLLIFLALFIATNLFRIDYGVYLRYRDGWWYLNRAWLHSHGIFDEVSFYTLAYPLMIGLVNFIVTDLPVSALIVNLICQFFALMGIYVLGAQVSGRLAGTIGVFVFALGKNNFGDFSMLYTLHPNVLFMPVSVWIVALAIQLSKQPSRRWSAGIGTLLAVAPFIRTEGFLWSLVALVAFAAMRFQGCTWQTVGKHLLIIALIVSPAWIVYLLWFFAGADMPSGVGSSLDGESLEVALRALGTQVSEGTWAIMLAGAVALFLRKISWNVTGEHISARICIKVNNLTILMLLFPFFIISYSAVLFPRIHGYSYPYTFPAIPYISVICGIVLSEMLKLFLTRLAAVVAFVIIVCNAFSSIEPLPLPLEYQISSASIRQAIVELMDWKRANNHSEATFYTLCTDLMIFAQFDVRLPYTTLLFSSRRFAPPKQVLPQIAERNDLLVVCPSFIGDLYIHPFNEPWTRLYRYWSGVERDNPELADMARYPLEEVGRVREYIIYRVKSEGQNAQ